MGYQNLTLNNIYEKVSYDRHINFEDLRNIVLSQAILCKYEGNNVIFTTDKNYKQEKIKTLFGETQNIVEIILISKEDFNQLLIDLFTDFFQDYCYSTRKKLKNSKNLKDYDFKRLKNIILIIGSLFLIGFFLPFTADATMFSLLVFYAFNMTIKSLVMLNGIKLYFCERNTKKNEKHDKINTENMPIYSILIPMYNENRQTIQNIIASMERLNYPKDKLDVIFVLEFDDNNTREVLKNITLPEYITPVYVPYFEPRTKPKACVICALLARGEMIVIFDAEDCPEPDQLRQSVEMMRKESDISVIQGCLSFYNYDENLLTRLFNIEYLVWFRIFLSSLVKMGFTIPLGGTTNHFRYKDLQKYHFWDGYHVTEDLELSMVIEKYGDKIGHLRSSTLEWGTNNLRAWIKQRTRWMKGYFLTYYMSFWSKNFNTNWKDFLFLHVVVGFSSISFLLYPFMIFSTFAYKGQTTKFIFLLVSCLYYFTIITSYIIICKDRLMKVNSKTITAFAVYPFYFILHCIGAWRGVLQLFTKPFYWEKTQHDPKALDKYKNGK